MILSVLAPVKDGASFLDSDSEDESARDNRIGLAKAEDERGHGESMSLSKAAAAVCDATFL